MDRRRLALFDPLHAFFQFSHTVQCVLSRPLDRLEELMEVEKPVAKLGVPLRLGRRILTRRHSDVRRCERAQSRATQETRRIGVPWRVVVEIVLAHQKNLRVERALRGVQGSTVTDEPL